MAPRIPGIEIADHRDALGVGRPDREAHAGTPSMVATLAPQRIGQIEVAALVEQMQVELAQQRPEGIGILGLLHRARPFDAQQIGRRVSYGALEQARLHLGQRSQRGTIGAAQHLDPCAPGKYARMARPSGPSCGPSTRKELR